MMASADTDPTVAERVTGASPEYLQGAMDGEAAPEEDTTAGAQENVTDPIRPVSRDWKLYRRELDRIGAAIERASAYPDGTTGQSQDTQHEKAGIKSINLSFKDQKWYRIPWEACCTWKRMEILLRTWFEGDEEGLKDLDQGNYTLMDTDDLVLPQLWEKVLTQNANIYFSRTAPSAPATRPASPVKSVASEAPKTVPETEYETRLRYSIKYFRRGRYESDDDDFETSSVYEEPVGFEVENLYEKLPALEEIQEIIAPRYASPRRKNESKRDGRKVKLRPYDRIGKTKLKINSPFLLNVLRSVVTYSSGMPEDDDEGLSAGIFEHPYKDLYLHLDALQDYKTQSTGLRARHSDAFNAKFDEHMDLLREYLERQPGVLIKELRLKWDKPKPTTSFASIWLLLKPGSDVYVRENDGSLNAYVVDSVRGGVVVKDGRKTTVPYSVEVWHLILGTRTIRPWLRSVEISIFDNDREVSSLPVFPVRIKDDTDGGETKTRLISRGEQYFKYSKRPNFLQYSGIGLKEGKSYKRARVVVEHASEPWNLEDFNKPELVNHCPKGDDKYGLSIRMARCECQECKAAAIVEDVHTMRFSNYRNIDPIATQSLSPHEYMLMSSHMFAFVLRDRTYDLLDVHSLAAPEIADTAIDKLVMDSVNKDIIKAIAKIYTDNAPTGRFSADFISGKGEGQIILLHGPPGTGKTLTAESVAEYTKRPLLSITAADLGHEPDALERSLLRYFRRATDWDAIVLLDEADVYLEQRSVEDLQRNSIVSVFLRAMDYFQGILFLTTNRVGQFDEAFASRIHLSLGYDKLDDKARGQIWDNLFQKLREDHRKKIGPEIDFGISAKQYVKTKEVMALEWNGREIRNAFQTAVALAVYDAKHQDGTDPPYLTEDHLEQVVAMSSAFRDYMTKTRQGMNNSDWAAFRGNRYDSLTNRSGTAKGR